jgi:hypothetical protein
LLSQARFIHIHRDPGRVAHSLMHRRWIGSIDDGVRAWGQYVTEILDFLEELPAHQTLTVAYRHRIEDADMTANSIADFLGLTDASPIGDFLAR